MKPLHIIAILFVFLAGSIAISFQHFKSESSDISALSETVELVFEVKQHDLKLNEDALKASNFKLVHFDGIVKTVENLRQTLRKANKAMDDVHEIKGTETYDNLKHLNEAINRRIDLIERLKAKVALARNSSNFLLLSLREHVEDYGLNASALALRALNEIQGYQIFPTQERLKSTQHILKQLREQNDKAGDQNNFSNALLHMEMSFQATKDIEAIIRNMFLQDSQGMIAEIIEHLNRIQENRQKQSTQFSYNLMGMSVLIFLALAYAIYNWNKARMKSQRTSQLFQDAVESMSEGFAFFDPAGKLVFWNSTFEVIYKGLGDALQKGMTLSDFNFALKEHQVLLNSQAQQDGSRLENLADGRWVLSSDTPIRHGGQALVRVDLTEQKKAEEQLHLAATVFESAGEAMMVTDVKDRIQMVNPAFSTITGYNEEEVIGKTPQILNSGRHDKQFFLDMFHSLQDDGTWQGEIWNRRKNGEIFPEWLSITSIYDENEKVIQRVGLFTDITNRKKSEERIHYQANYDSLTGLPNRNLFRDRLNQAISSAKRHRNRVALLFIDIDNFKHINDTLGHMMGDEMLRTVAKRLKNVFRGSDTIARPSGDEFCVIVNDAERNVFLEQLLDRLLSTLSEPYVLDGSTTYTSASVGVTFYPDDGDSVDTLQQNADTAMFKAKDMGRNTYCFFTSEMNTRAQERHETETALHRALANNEFEMYYQPIVDPVSHTVVSTEALIRWNCPEKGLISPVKFIPVAEDCGLIVPMGEWIIRQACRDAARWNSEKDLHVGVSVNLSSPQFQRSDLVAIVKDSLKETGLAPERLTLEITESVLVDDDSEILETLRKLRDLGVLLSIDDFGTGYSSLSYLKKFPLTTLKIDRSFINGVLTNSEDSALTEAILSMAHSLNLKVVAEGVESSGQVAYLLERRCDLIQGYFYSKPLPVQELLAAFEEKKLHA